MIEYNAAKRPSGLRACADGLDSNPDKDFAQKCMRYAADKMEELGQQRDRLAEELKEAQDAIEMMLKDSSCRRIPACTKEQLAAVKGGSHE